MRGLLGRTVALSSVVLSLVLATAMLSLTSSAFLPIPEQVAGKAETSRSAMPRTSETSPTQVFLPLVARGACSVQRVESPFSVESNGCVEPEESSSTPGQLSAFR